MLFNKTITIFFLLLATTITLVSCKKSNDGLAPLPVPATKQLVKIKTNDTDSTMLTYTGTGKLASIVSTEGDEDIDLITYQFSYDNSDKLTQIATNIGVRYHFDYYANRLKLVQNYFNLVKLSELNMTYTNDKLTGSTLFTAYPQEAGVINFRPTF